MNIDLFARTCPEQIFLRFAKLDATKNAHDPLLDAQTPVRNRFVQIDCNRPTETAAFRARAQRIIEAEESGSRWTYIEVAMRAVPAGGEGELFNCQLRIADCGLPIASTFDVRRSMFGVLRRRHDIDFTFAEAQRGFDSFDQTRASFV